MKLGEDFISACEILAAKPSRNVSDYIGPKEGKQMDNSYKSGSVSEARTLAVPATILESIVRTQGDQAAELQNVRQRLSDLCDRLRGLPDENKKQVSGPSPPREVPSNTVRKFEMVTQDAGMFIAEICEHISRLEAL